MGQDEIKYFNRYTKQVETEKVYGQAFLKWTYGNPLGRLSLHGFVKRAFFSKWYGRRMDHPDSRAKVDAFIKDYTINVDEFHDKPTDYKTFNEFFYRKLKPSARPVAADKDVVVFPADGRHLGFQDISKAPGIFVKGSVFSVEKLIGNPKLAERFKDGTLVLSRLCPVDYHRFHFPVGGVPGPTIMINGPLYSVNPIALKQNIHIFTENKRAYCEIDTADLGKVLMFEIGATCVGSFEYTYKPGVAMKTGDEKGYFKFGGSSTITLFEKGRIQLDADLLECSSKNMELYARIGDQMGRKIK